MHKAISTMALMAMQSPQICRQCHCLTRRLPDVTATSLQTTISWYALTGLRLIACLGHCRRGRVLLQLGHQQAGVRDARAAARASSRSVFILRGCSGVLERAHDFHGALQLLQQAQQLPGSPTNLQDQIRRLSARLSSKTCMKPQQQHSSSQDHPQICNTRSDG